MNLRGAGRLARRHQTTNARKVALVTGAGKRLGRAIALAMADQGWDIVVHYRHSEDDADLTVLDIESRGRRALLPRAADFGRVSCVVNNAALFEQDSAGDFSMARLDAHMHANLAAPVLLAQALHAITPENEQAVVINLLDQKLHNLNPDFLSYTLSKAALETATTMLAQALAPKVRVVGVAPGITLQSGDQTPEAFAKAHQVTPLGRSSLPEDVAAAVCYLAQAGAVTGTTLLVDGGQHLMPLPRDVMFLAI
jgi:NAD(P)-dependent dehydrogenase (short-subunit alcohol dehydrogenase family)